MLDARHCRAKCRQSRLLLQEAIEIALHRGQFAFGNADLVLARTGADDARRIFGIVVERHHRARDPPHRPDHDDVETCEYQKATDQRHNETGDDHAPGIGDERGAYRRFAQNDADRLGTLDVGRRDDMQRPIAAVQQAVEAVTHAPGHHHVRQVDRLVDCVRHALDQEEFTLFGPFQKHRRGAGPFEQLLAQGRRELVASRLGEGQDSKLSGLDMILEQLTVVSADRGHENEHLANHHIEYGQQKQTARKTMGDKPIAFRKSGA